MIRLSFKIIGGLLLAGCSVNNMHLASINTVSFSSPEAEQIQKETLSTIPNIAPTLPPPVIVTGNTRIRPGCVEYKPLPVPKPIRIDMKQLEAAETAEEINVIVLSNVKKSHILITQYATQSSKHYADYKRKCVID